MFECVGAVEVREAVAQLRCAFDVLAAEPVDALTRADLLTAMDELDALANQLPTQWRRLLARLQGETTPKALGGKSWNAVLRQRWRLSSAEASRRLAECAELGPRRSLTGEPLPPRRRVLETWGCGREGLCSEGVEWMAA